MWSFIDFLVEDARREELTDQLRYYGGVFVFILFAILLLSVVFG